MTSINSLLKRSYLKTILLVVPTSLENLNSFLSPVLGQYGLDIASFIDQFSTKVRFFKGDLVVRVSLTLFSDNTFVFSIVPISYALILRSCLNSRSTSELSAYELYKILYLYLMVSRMAGAFFMKIVYLNLRGYLHSYNAISAS